MQGNCFGRFLPTSSSKSVPIPSICFAIFVWKWALGTVSSTFCRPHLPKVLRTCPFFWWNRALATVWWQFCRPHLPKVLRMWHSFNILIELSIQSCALFFSSTTFADRGPKPRKQRPYFGDHGSRVRECFQGVMMWLTWWHDDVVAMTVRMLAMTIVHNLEVFKLNFLWQLYIYIYYMDIYGQYMNIYNYIWYIWKYLYNSISISIKHM
jgi:hypothetical protein